jgi:hypothetical protein
MACRVQRYRATEGAHARFRMAELNAVVGTDDVAHRDERKPRRQYGGNESLMHVSLPLRSG